MSTDVMTTGEYPDDPLPGPSGGTSRPGGLRGWRAFPHEDGSFVVDLIYYDRRVYIAIPSLPDPGETVEATVVGVRREP